MVTKKKAGMKAYLSALLMTVLWFALASLIFIFVLRETSPVPVFVTFALIQSIAMILFALLPGRGKTTARVVSMFCIGSCLMMMAGIAGRTNLQIEGFFFYVLSGTVSGAIVHFAMAKILGPLLYNRNWCGWGCWTSMVLDLLPYRDNVKWKPGNLRYLRFFHFILSFGIVAAVYFGLNHSVVNTNASGQTGTRAELIWFLAGNAIYYAAGITMALVMKDNRAFCKYVCPITALYKTIGRFSLLRIAGDGKKCSGCATCVLKCPMGIDIPRYIRNGQRVKSTDCILCLHCIAACPEAVLKTSVGLDFAGKNHLR